MIELRGHKAQRGELWAVALQVRSLAATVFEDFPGLPLSCELTCPGCLGSMEHREAPTKWSADDAMSRPLRCELCGEQVQLQLVKADQVPAPKPLSLSLNVSDEEAERELRAHGGIAGAELKYIAEKMRFGKPIESSLALHKLLGIEEEELSRLRQAGEAAIIDEVAAHGRHHRDEYGWTDSDWMKYVKDGRVNERQPPEVLEEFSASPLSGHSVGAPSGGFSASGAPIEGFDKGHQGMKLDDFLNHPLAVTAGLKRQHVLALRLYSCSVYRSINKPLHDGCSPERPHPYPALVANITEAFRKLRAAAEENQIHGKVAGLSLQPAPLTLWRGAHNIDLSNSEFKQRGGTEVSVLSTSTNRSVAEQWAVRAAKASAQAAADKGEEVEKASFVLLRVRIDNPSQFGADLSPFSVFPHEREFFYPPCTYLEPRGEHEETVRVGGEEITFKVVEVTPSLAAL